MNDITAQKPITRESIGTDLIERYTGSSVKDFQPYILLTNFQKYVDFFAASAKRRILQGSAMSVCHDENKRITIINYGVGSPLAALIVELLSLLKPKATLMLGMCGGLREKYKIGDYFNPVAAIRDEGTSLSYMPERCPALSSFVIQRYVCKELERNNIVYHTGVVHTTNVRWWEFNEKFRGRLREEEVQAIDMECATLFTVGFAAKVALGALMMITDLPLKLTGIKTKDSANEIFEERSLQHVQMGINVFLDMQKEEQKGFGYQF
jgi:AMP nucleosidase